ncbi:MAG: WYL domain-containing protein [Lewinellaceae bacterium]|nr:WYL domain-containing protein [Lewinellaceae bacterium]
MAKEAEYSTRTRILRVLRAILDRPYAYTKKELAEQYGVSPDTIKGDIEAMQNAGFELQQDERYRFAFVTNQPHKQLKDLLHFSEEEQSLLHEAIDNLPASTERHQKLKSKLSALYDFRRLGHVYLRKPYLTKVDLLLQARDEKRQALLIDYRSSNSNAITTRMVEPFHVSPAEDTLQAFDLGKQMLRHFRISRFVRVQLTDTPWQYAGHHNILPTDPFRIVGADQVNVHLRLGVGAYNELVERFPLTKAFTEESEDPGVFDFQCKVNRGFLGLSNFILGFYHQHIEVVEPEELKVHLMQEVGRMQF